MDELAAVLDALASDDLPAVSGPQLLERLRRLLAAQNRLAAEVARTVRQAELTSAAEHDGLKTMASWLRGHGHLSTGEAGRVVATGRALEQLPAVAAACAAGAVTAGQAALLAPVAEPGNLARAAAQDVDLAEVDAALAVAASLQTHQELAGTVRGYLDRLDPDGPEPDPTEGRRLVIAKHADGALSIRGQLDAAGGEKLQAVLESVVQADRPAGDERSRAHRLGDALVQLADNALASGSLPTLRGHKPQIAVVIDLADLADPGTGPGAARMGFGAVISAARARWLACDGAVSRVVFGPDGAPLDLGREQRLADRPAPPQGPAASSRVAGGGGVLSLVVRGAPPGALARRRWDQPGELGAAVRTAPRQGPPRLPRRTTTGRAMAHLAPRRHRDRHRRRPATGRLTTPGHRHVWHSAAPTRCSPTSPGPPSPPTAGCRRADGARARLAETTPGPLIMVVRFVAFLGAFRAPAASICCSASGGRCCARSASAPSSGWPPAWPGCRSGERG
ncbi:hypothetical protein JOD57_004650 [Geodermatophilus bullaregiensis]|nr:hypothetical protein [Geodermatophilus bullaregiensis]